MEDVQDLLPQLQGTSARVGEYLAVVKLLSTSRSVGRSAPCWSQGPYHFPSGTSCPTTTGFLFEGRWGVDFTPEPEPAALTRT